MCSCEHSREQQLCAVARRSRPRGELISARSQKAKEEMFTLGFPRPGGAVTTNSWNSFGLCNGHSHPMKPASWSPMNDFSFTKFAYRTSACGLLCLSFHKRKGARVSYHHFLMETRKRRGWQCVIAVGSLAVPLLLAACPLIGIKKWPSLSVVYGRTYNTLRNSLALCFLRPFVCLPTGMSAEYFPK